jgi:hypothetical protein
MAEPRQIDIGSAALTNLIAENMTARAAGFL